MNPIEDLPSLNSLYAGIMNMQILIACFLLVPSSQATNPKDLAEKLRSESAKERELAASELRRLGIEAIPILQKLTEDSDQEVVSRSRELLRFISADLARASFHKIEERIDRAKTIAIKYTDDCSVTGGRRELNIRTKGNIYFGEKNRIHISEECIEGASTTSHKLISDGSRIWAKYNGESKPSTGRTPEKLTRLLSSVLTRESLQTVPLNMWLQCENPIDASADPRDRYVVSEFESHEREGDAHVLGYSHKISTTSPHSVKITLWYDPESFRMLKRKTEISHGPVKRLNVETYQEFVFNASLPDELFVLPAEK